MLAFAYKCVGLCAAEHVHSCAQGDCRTRYSAGSAAVRPEGQLRGTERERERERKKDCVRVDVYICDREKERDRERDDNLAVHCTCPYYSRLVSSSRYALTDTRTIIYFIRNGSQTQSSSPPPKTRVRAENSAQNKRTRTRRLYITYR